MTEKPFKGVQPPNTDEEPRPRAILYLRVSTKKQVDDAKSDIDSLYSQESALRRACAERGYEVIGVEKDIASSKDLNRPGITKVRQLIRAKAFEVLCAVSLDRIAGADDFGMLFKEMKAHNVEFFLSDEPIAFGTPTGDHTVRSHVANKELSRASIGTKVKRSLKEMFDKEMFTSGPPPFGFRKDPETLTLYIDPDEALIIQRMFDVYIETRSDFAVRKWLKAQGISAPTGKVDWAVGTIRDRLTSKRYIGLIERNRRNEGRTVLNPDDRYEVHRATTFPAIISAETWELAQKIRREQAQKNPRTARNRVIPKDEFTAENILAGDLRGATHSDSQTKTGHVFLLQGLLFCPCCGHPMSPDYTEKKPNPKEQRKSHTFVPYYACSLLRKSPNESRELAKKLGTGITCGRVLASRVESWAIGLVNKHARDILMINTVREVLPGRVKTDLGSTQDLIEQTSRRIREVEQQQRTLFDRLLQPGFNEAAISIINKEAADLEQQRIILVAERTKLREMIEQSRFTSYDETLDRVLDNFAGYAHLASREELREILNLMVRRITCDKAGIISAELYRLYLPEERYPGLLHRNEQGELEWIAAGSRVPWELMRLKTRLKKGVTQSKAKPTRKRRHATRKTT